tara:strand:+ start:661 stop:879 length:219 start_codon:yes stop_codon:yes gene_type:complete
MEKSNRKRISKTIMRKVIISDDKGEEIQVDLKKFMEHIDRFHKTGTSIHDEDGHYFTVNESFRNKLKEIENK